MTLQELSEELRYRRDERLGILFEGFAPSFEAVQAADAEAFAWLAKFRALGAGV